MSTQHPLGFNNLVDALAAARKEGYTLDFNIKGDQLTCDSIDKCFIPAEIKVDQKAHIEGMDSSADSRSTLYFISSSDGEKGVLIEPDPAYVEEAELKIIEMLRK